nr:hypothetical protein [Tanacetum cinerariifolium]
MEEGLKVLEEHPMDHQEKDLWVEEKVWFLKRNVKNKVLIQRKMRWFQRRRGVSFIIFLAMEKEEEEKCDENDEENEEGNHYLIKIRWINV